MEHDAAFSVRSTDIKPVFFSDHCLLLASCHVQDDQQAGKGMWKLNVKLLTPENIEELKGDYTDWRTMKPLFESPGDWKDLSLRGVAIPGSRGLQVKASLYMDAVFYSDPLSVSRLLSICDQFEMALGAKVNRGKSKAVLFGNWANRSFIPFTIRTQYLKVLGVWFGEAGVCTKTWEERVTK
eukprot:g32920.t1